MTDIERHVKTRRLRLNRLEGGDIKKVCVTVTHDCDAPIEEIEACVRKAIEDRISGKTPTLEHFPESGREKKTVKEALNDCGG